MGPKLIDKLQSNFACIMCITIHICLKFESVMNIHVNVYTQHLYTPLYKVQNFYGKWCSCLGHTCEKKIYI